MLANPSTTTVPARITALGTDKPGEPESLDLPPGRTVLRPLVADTAASATVVEAFDADVGVGFQVRGGGAQTGLGAEPCLSAAATAWWTSSISTAQDDHASLVVMNPFRAQAVFDITLYSPDGPPLRRSGVDRRPAGAGALGHVRRERPVPGQAGRRGRARGERRAHRRRDADDDRGRRHPVGGGVAGPRVPLVPARRLRRRGGIDPDRGHRRRRGPARRGPAERGAAPSRRRPPRGSPGRGISRVLRDHRRRARPRPRSRRTGTVP